MDKRRGTYDPAIITYTVIRQQRLTDSQYFQIAKSSEFAHNKGNRATNMRDVVGVLVALKLPLISDADVMDVASRIVDRMQDDPEIGTGGFS